MTFPNEGVWGEQVPIISISVFSNSIVYLMSQLVPAHNCIVYDLWVCDLSLLGSLVGSSVTCSVSLIVSFLILLRWASPA